MKLVLLLVLSCVALHTGTGAPATGKYMLVRCNPKDNKANCVIYQSSEVAVTPDMPIRLPASSAKHLETEPVEDEHPDREGGEEDMKTEEPPLVSDEGESPLSSYDYGSGFDEGSADGGVYVADRDFVTTEKETGSGESDMDLYTDRKMISWHLEDEAKPAEDDLKEDHLLQM